MVKSDFNPIQLWRDDVVEFVHAMWPKITLEPWQVEFLDALCNKTTDKDRIAVRSGHGVGKTAALAIAALWFLLTRPNGIVLVTANSQDQLKDNNWAEMRRWIAQMPKIWGRYFDVQATHIRCEKMGSFATARTASRENPEALQGLHSDHVLILCDEASGIPDIVFETGRGSLSTPGSKLVLTGNPTRGQGEFYDAFNILADHYYKLHVPSTSVHRATGHIEDIRKKHGEDSNPYRIRVLGEFPKEDDDQVIPRYLCDEALRRKVDYIDAPVIWGVDVAEGVGRDRTALVKRRGNALLEKELKPIQTWLTKDPMQIAGILHDEYKNHLKRERPFSINIDTIGIGAGLFYRCKELGLPVKKVNVAESPSSKERFLRLRDELWFEAREWFEGLDVSLDKDNPKVHELISELCSPSYQINSNGKMRVETKQEMKKRGISSPDIAEAFLMTLIRTSAIKRKPLEMPKLAIV